MLWYLSNGSRDQVISTLFLRRWWRFDVSPAAPQRPCPPRSSVQRFDLDAHSAPRQSPTEAPGRSASSSVPNVERPSRGAALCPPTCSSTQTPGPTLAHSVAKGSTRSQTWRNTPIFTQVRIFVEDRFREWVGPWLEYFQVDFRQTLPNQSKTKSDLFQERSRTSASCVRSLSRRAATWSHTCASTRATSRSLAGSVIRGSRGRWTWGDTGRANTPALCNNCRQVPAWVRRSTRLPLMKTTQKAVMMWRRALWTPLVFLSSSICPQMSQRVVILRTIVRHPFQCLLASQFDDIHLWGRIIAFSTCITVIGPLCSPQSIQRPNIKLKMLFR